MKKCDANDYGLNKCKSKDLDKVKGCVRDHNSESDFVFPNF